MIVFHFHSVLYVQLLTFFWQNTVEWELLLLLVVVAVAVAVAAAVVVVLENNLMFAFHYSKKGGIL